MPGLSDLTGYAPAQVLNGGYTAIDPDLAYNPQTYGSEQMTPEQIAAWQQQFWIPKIATGGYIPPEYDNPEAMAALGQTDAYNQRMQYLAQQGAQRVATLQDEQAAQRRGGPAALGYAAIGIGAGLAGGLAGGAAGGAGSGAATTYPLASGGPVTATPLTTGAGAGTVAGSTTAAGVGGMGSIGANGLGALSPAAGAGTGAATAAGLGGLGLGGWLTVGALGAQALQGNKDITTNQTNEPPAYIAPYLRDAAGKASELYGQGNYVAPVQDAAINYGTNVLSGNYLNSNPYLDETFNRAAGAVTNQVQSNFAVSGRNARGVDAAGFAGDLYSGLANQIYGGNYQAERARQQQIVPYAGQLGSYTNPGQSLDDYIARLRNLSGGYGTSTSTTPTQSNLFNGLAGLGLAMMG